MTGAALSTIRTKIKALVGMSLSVNMEDVAAITSLTNIVQRELLSRYDWQHLRKTVDVTASTQYTDRSTGLDWERNVRAWVKDSNHWYQLEYGISQSDYNRDDEASDPARRWALYDTDQFEIWPKPQNAQTIRFRGQVLVADMVAETDTAVLDDILLSLAVATELLYQYESKFAQTMQQRYTQREVQLRRNSWSRDRQFILGGDPMQDRLRSGGTRASSSSPTWGSETLTFND